MEFFVFVQTKLGKLCNSYRHSRKFDQEPRFLQFLGFLSSTITVVFLSEKTIEELQVIFSKSKELVTEGGR